MVEWTSEIDCVMDITFSSHTHSNQQKNKMSNSIWKSALVLEGIGFK